MFSMILEIGQGRPSHLPQNYENHNVFNDFESWAESPLFHPATPKIYKNHDVFNGFGGPPPHPTPLKKK